MEYLSRLYVFRKFQLECAKTYRRKGLKQTYAKNPRGDS